MDTKPLKIIVASLNPQKVTAVRELCLEYPVLSGATITSTSVKSGISEQPQSLEETVRGAINRAKVAYSNVDYSFGIESGLCEVPHTKTGVMDVCVCAIYDGKNTHIGLSSAFEPPKKVLRIMREQGMEMSDAVTAAGLSSKENVGYAEGLVGILTHGRLTRLSYTKQAITTALIHLENAHLFHE